MFKGALLRATRVRERGARVEEPGEAARRGPRRWVRLAAKT